MLPISASPEVIQVKALNLNAQSKAKNDHSHQHNGTKMAVSDIGEAAV